MAGEWRVTTLGEFVACSEATIFLRRIVARHGADLGSAGQNGFHDTALATVPVSSSVEAESGHG